MITNDRQYKISKARISEFQESLDELMDTKTNPENVHPRIFDAHKRAVEAQINELIADVAEYEALKAGKIVITEVKSLQELPTVLIKARIANGMTQSDLAKVLDLKEQQVQRYESELYGAASLKTLLRIAEALSISVQGEAQLKEVEYQTQSEQYNPKNYPFKEMFKRNWFPFFKGTINDAMQNAEKILFQFFDKASFGSHKYSLTKKSLRTGSTLNQLALDAWYAQIIHKASFQRTDKLFEREFISDMWLKSLAELSTANDLHIVREYLNQIGIRFVVESPLEGTFLDGAALLVENKYPIIALTLRHDRLDNFWFVLFHELAHIKLHLGNNIEAIFDDLDAASDGIEKEADEFALNALIPNDVWRKSLVRFSPSNEAVINQAKKMNINPALIAGRIRRETGKYFILVDLVGQGEVRHQFLNELNN